MLEINKEEEGKGKEPGTVTAGDSLGGDREHLDAQGLAVRSSVLLSSFELSAAKVYEP